MMPNLIQSQISLNRAHINNLHMAALDSKSCRDYYYQQGKEGFAKLNDNDFVAISKKIARYVVLQKALKKLLCSAYKDSRDALKWKNMRKNLLTESIV